LGHGGDIGIELHPKRQQFWFTLPAVVVAAYKPTRLRSKMSRCYVTRNPVCVKGSPPRSEPPAEIAALDGQGPGRCVIVDAGTSAVPDPRAFRVLLLRSCS